MKEKLTGALGSFGIVVWYAISFLYSFSPLLVLRFGFILSFILIAVMIMLPFVGEIVRLGLYIWAIITVASSPIDFLSILFFVIAALYLFTTVYPIVVSVLASLFSED